MTSRTKIDVLTNVSFLVALAIVLTRVFGVMIPVGGGLGLRLSFGEIPLMLAGVLFGPAAGAMAGGAADLIGFLINPHGGPYFPGFTLSAVLTGLLPGLLLFRRRGELPWWKIFQVVLLTDFLTGILLNTLWVTIIIDTGFFVLLWPRLLSRIVTIPVYTAVIAVVRRAYLMSREGTYMKK